MNYEKNANKHYEYIVSAAKSHKNAGNDLYYDAWLLYALCKYFSVCGKPAAYSEQIEKAVLAPEKTFNACDAKSVKAYSVAAKALCLLAKTSSDDNAKKAANKIFDLLIDGFYFTENERSEDTELAEAYCGAISAIADLYKNDKNKAVAFAMDNLRFFIDENYRFSDSESAFNGAIGLLLLSSCDASFLGAALTSGKKFAAMNGNLDYSFNLSFRENDTADPVATSLAMNYYTILYKATGDRFFLYMARRIWFNAMQFFERFGGFVGFNNSPCAPQGLLSIKTYKEEKRTPQFCEGLCAYEKNKELFAEYDAPVKKDPRGRYIVDDKVFARELGEYFGRDLIEIPSLLSFDEETARGFKFKLLF